MAARRGTGRSVRGAISNILAIQMTIISIRKTREREGTTPTNERNGEVKAGELLQLL